MRLLDGSRRLVGHFPELLLIGGREAALAEFDHDFLEVARELEWHLFHIVLNDGRAGVHADIERLIEREAGGDGALNLALRDLLAVHGERAGAALAYAGAVVFEVELDGVLAGSKLLLRGDTILVLLLVGECVSKFRFTVQEEQSPAAEPSALRDEHAVGPAVRNFHFRRDGEVLVLQVRRRAFGNTDRPRADASRSPGAARVCASIRQLFRVYGRRNCLQPNDLKMHRPCRAGWELIPVGWRRKLCPCGKVQGLRRTPLLSRIFSVASTLPGRFYRAQFLQPET